MKFTLAILTIITLILFVIVLQKWRKSIKESSIDLDSERSKRNKKMTAFLVDLFSIGFIGTVLLLIYFMALK